MVKKLYKESSISFDRELEETPGRHRKPFDFELLFLPSNLDRKLFHKIIKTESFDLESKIINLQLKSYRVQIFVSFM